MTTALIIFVAIVVILNIAVSRNVYRSHKFDGRQKSFQFALIWLVPVIGSIASYSFLNEARDERFTTDLSDRGGSGDYDRSAHTPADYGGGGGDIGG